MAGARAAGVQADRCSTYGAMTGPLTIPLRGGSENDLLHLDVLAVARTVVGVCADLISADPPRGWRAFAVQQPPDGKPTASLNGLPGE